MTKKLPTLTKIIATLGPATDDVASIRALIDAGARAFRINFSHGDFDDYDRLLRCAREAATQADVPVGVIGDLRGPKIRIGEVVDNGVAVESGQTVQLQKVAVMGNKSKMPEVDAAFSLTPPEVLDSIKLKQRVLIDDGSIALRTIEKRGEGTEAVVRLRVETGGVVHSRKGVNLPDTSLDLPGVTDDDWKCVDWAVDRDVDFLALSFVRSAKCIDELRAGLEKRGSSLPVIAKIEKPEALTQLDAVVDAADAVMVARGDLGVEMDLAEVPEAQQAILDACYRHGRTGIVATQMLQSMIDNATPTRAEVSDVAGAIYNGADVVMLSGETAVGKYPAEAVSMMSRIAAATRCRVLREDFGRMQGPPPRLHESRYRTGALAHGVYVVAKDLEAKLVATWTLTGGGARYLSKMRMSVPILAFSQDEAALGSMSLAYGVLPVHAHTPESRDAFFRLLDQYALDHGLAEKGDPVVAVIGEPLGSAGVTTQLQVHYLGDALK